MNDNDLPAIPITIFNSMMDAQSGVLNHNYRGQEQELLIIPSFKRNKEIKVSDVKFIERPPMSVAVED
jgi:hypothetical protein